MITEKDLRSAIAECEGQRNPNANTCIKLAAFYTILNNLYPKETKEQERTEPLFFDSVPVMNSDSEFINACSQKGIEGVLGVLDEHMQAIKLLYPKEYDSIIEKIRDL